MPDQKREEFFKLIGKYLDGSASQDQLKLLDRYYELFRDEPEATGNLSDVQKQLLEQRMEDHLFARIDRSPAKRVVRRLWPRIAAAASILLVLSIGGYFVLRQQHKPVEITQIKPGTFKNDALPGNKAILTLGNGQQLALTSIHAGHIANTNIQKMVSGALVYTQSINAPDLYNTFTVPRGGGKHELQLADGTLVLLDAESSIRYPVAFNGTDRRVSITGQVYFEVAHNGEKRFYVTVGNQTIQDIGTHFNVNAYDGEVKTTLIEGSIKVNNTLLKPGQQAIQRTNGGMIVNDHVDEEGVLAWKNDLFKFGDDASLETVMNQLGRWYDLDVVYEGQHKPHSFGGVISRNLKLSSVCKILSLSGVQFSVDGKKIMVYQ